MKDIVIISNFCGSLEGISNNRFQYLADMLAKENEVELVTSDFNHGSKKYYCNFTKERSFSITMLHERAYPTNICIRRCLGHYLWGRNVVKYLRKRKRPDVVYCAVPTLKAAYDVSRFCVKRDIRFIIDIQDLWPEAFAVVFNAHTFGTIVCAPFRCLADAIYKRADAICAVSDTYCQRALKVNKKCNMGTVVFLGTELAAFDNNVTKDGNWKKNDEKIWLAYCGTLGVNYDLTIVIDALHFLNNDKIRLIVMGDGPRKEYFQQYAKEKRITATFTGKLQYDRMCCLLSACDFAVNPIVHMSAQSIINKHADYAAAGLPVISTQESNEYRDLINEYQMGFNCSNDDIMDLAGKINILSKDEKLRMQMGKNARRCAEERFDRARTYSQLVEQFLITDDLN